MRPSQSYSLWLMPKGKVLEGLSKIILNLSAKYSTPVFLPHVTLVSSFQGNEKKNIKNLNKLLSSKSIRPFKVILKNISYSDKFFRSLYIDCKKNKNLVYVRDEALRFFSCKEKTYMPHLSLIYGELNHYDKQQIISDVSNSYKQFLADELFLAYNDEQNLKWEIIESVKLER